MKTNNRIRSSVTRIVLGPVICLAGAAFALGQGANASVKSFRQVMFSQDGAHLAWVEALPAEGGGSAIYVQDIESSTSQPRHVSAAGDGSNADEEDVSWSPDSKQLAFLSNAAGDKQSELYVADRDGGAVRKLTSLKGFLADPT